MKTTTADKKGRKHARFDLDNLEHFAPESSATSTPTSGTFLKKESTKQITPARKFARSRRGKPSPDLQGKSRTKTSRVPKKTPMNVRPTSPSGDYELPHFALRMFPERREEFLRGMKDYARQKRQQKAEKARASRESAPSPEPSPPLGTKQPGARPLDSPVVKRTRSSGQPLTVPESLPKKSKKSAKSAVKKSTPSATATKKSKVTKPAAKKHRKRSFSDAMYKLLEDSEPSSAEPSPVLRGPPKRKTKDHPDARFTIPKKDLQNDDTTPSPTPKKRGRPLKKTSPATTDTMFKNAGLKGGSAEYESKQIACAKEPRFTKKRRRANSATVKTSAAKKTDSKSEKASKSPLKPKVAGVKKTTLKNKAAPKTSATKSSITKDSKASKAKVSTKASKASEAAAPTKPKTKRTTHVHRREKPTNLKSAMPSEKPSEKSIKPVRALPPPPNGGVDPMIAHWTRRMRWHVENDELWRDLHGH